MNIGIVGLGLIGGSAARAVKYYTDDTVIGWNRSPDVIKKAKLLNAVDYEMTPERLGLCDIVIIALYPELTVNYIKKNYKFFKNGAVVMDTCGVKQYVCGEVAPLAKDEGFNFVGAHPMAGLAKVGFENSTPLLFNNASVILTPPEGTEPAVTEKAEKFWGSLGCTNIEITTPENHDRVIAYTSQLAHIASSAFIKSPTATDHKGFSAGSYKDLTRVAWLNEDMWTELFLENRDFLLAETKGLIKNLEDYAAALEQKDAKRLNALLRDGRIMKEKADEHDLN